MEDSYRSWVEVDLDNFTRNWEEMKRLTRPGVMIMQVLKADAYGHGAIEIANVALRNGAAYLGVANADEGVQLRVSGIDAPILILSPSLPNEISEIIKYNLSPSVSDCSFARELQERCAIAGIRLPIHIEVDTGMGRCGMNDQEAPRFISEILEMPNIFLEGVFTHLSISEVEDGYNLTQWRRFTDLLALLARSGIHIPIKHMANSGGMINYPEFQLDMVRPGIMSFGIFPTARAISGVQLNPVMTFKTRVVLIKEFPAGASIGYGRSFITARTTRIATIPVGYGDGYGFILSNQGEALVGGRRAPLVGRLSMDVSTIDVTDLDNCSVGEEVVLLGRQGEEHITANEIAHKLGSISYEILCALGKRAPRIFLQQGEIGAMEPRLRRIFIPDEERSLTRISNIIRHCLHTRTRSVDLGDAIYYEMLETMFGKEDRQLELRSDFRYDIKVAMPTGEDGDCAGGAEEGHLDVTVHIEYRKILKNHLFMIGCAGNNEQLAAFFEDSRCQYRWLLDGDEHLVPPRDFQVASVKIDGEEIPIIESLNTSRGYEVWAGGEYLREKLNRQVKIELEIATKKSRQSGNFSIHIVYPTRGLEINFHYGGTGLKNVREVCFFAGRRPYPAVSRQEGGGIRLQIPREEWVFPHSGVTFIWDN
ncbi:MAG: alanine racemase [Smithellaceae bacterium]|nr:alanine racemase [Smithellaceae bacterium]